MNNLKNLTSFENFKNSKNVISSNIIKEDFGGKGNVSGGADFFEDSKKTFVGGIVYKLGSFIRTKVYKQMLRNLAHRYNEELLAGVLQYSQANGLAISDDMKIFIKNEKSGEYDLEVLIGDNNKDIKVSKTIKYIGQESDKVEDGEYELSIMKKIKVKDGIIVELNNLDKEDKEEETQTENNGEYIFKFEDKDVKVFIPEKEIKVEASIYGFDSSGNTGKTLADGEYKYESKNITIEDSKITKIQETENKEETKYLGFAYNKENVETKIKNTDIKVNSTIEELEIGEYAINVFENEDKKQKGIKLVDCIIKVNDKHKIEKIYDKKLLLEFINTKIDDVKNILVDDFKKEKRFNNDENNNTKIIQEYQNKVNSKFKEISIFLSSIFKIIDHISFEKKEHDKLQSLITKLNNNLATTIVNSTNIKDPSTVEIAKSYFDSIIDRIEKEIKIPSDDVNKYENRTAAAEQKVGIETSSYRYNGDTLNEALNLFANKLKRTKLSNDLSKNLNNSYKENSLSTLSDVKISDENKTYMTKYVNLSNIIGIQIRAEQLYDNKKEDGKVVVALKKYWETLIQEVKGQYEKYMNVNLIDPIKLRNDLEKIRNGSDGYDKQVYGRETLDTKKYNIGSPNDDVFQTLLNINELKCEKFTGTIKKDYGDFILLNMVSVDNNIYTFICNVGNFGDNTYNWYKVLAVVDMLKVSKLIKKDTKIDYNEFKKCIYDFKKDVSTDFDENHSMEKLIKSLGFGKINSQREGNILYGNFLITNTQKTLKEKQAISIVPCNLNSKIDLTKLNITEDVDDKDKDKIKIYINSTMNELNSSVDIKYIKITQSPLYKVPNSSNYFNQYINGEKNSNIFYNLKVSLYYFKKLLVIKSKLIKNS